MRQVGAWDKSFNEKSYLADEFPEEVDKDKNGVVYYIMPGGKYELIRMVDLKEYNSWKETYITNETLKITVLYVNLTEKNINNI